MAVENPPLNRIHVLGYTANDRNYPIVSLVADPRVAGYRVPEDLSACPDKRYPNHVFTGAQPLSGDERVRHTWEILPSPYVPFTRYDDDLGPVQGRRRFVVNSGQEASLERDKKVTYEAREGSAIVSSEIEETWDGGSVDPDIDSPFPIKDRDSYDPSRGAIQERRQLVSTTGNEVATLENRDGVITQTSYEAYNEFLSFKVVQTYSVDGPQLVGKATDNDGQLITVTTQRKGADNYTPPSPTATKTVEVNREDAESLVERIVDTPEVFGAEIYRKTREDLTPQKFKAAQEDSTIEQNVDGTVSPTITLATGEFLKSEQQVNKFVKRVSTTSRSTTVTPEPLVEKVVTGEGQVGTRTLTLASGPQTISPSAIMVDGNVEALGDGRTVKSETFVPNVFSGKSVVKTKVDLTPEKFRAAQQDVTTEESVEGTVDPTIPLGTGEFRKSEQQVTEFVKRVSATSRDITASTDLEEVVITQQGQIAQRILTLSSQPQSIQPDELLVDGSIEELGDGRTIKTEVRVPSLFREETFSVERPDPLPQKFRVAARTRTSQQTIEGTADPNVDLDSDLGQISKSEQQITEFVKRASVTSRDQTQLPITLFQLATDNERQLVTVTESLQKADSIELPSATVTIQSESLGDGNFLVTKTEAPSVFGARSLTREKEESVPIKFRADIPIEVTEFNSDGEVKTPIITGNTISETQQQINKFVKRTTTRSRNISSPKSVEGLIYVSDLNGGTAKVVERLESFDTKSEFEPSFGTVSAEQEYIGNGRCLTRETKLESFEILSGQNFDETFGVAIPFKREIIPFNSDGGDIPDKTIANSIDDKDIFVFDGLRGTLSEDENGDIILTDQKTGEIAVVPASIESKLDSLGDDGPQFARSGTDDNAEVNPINNLHSIKTTIDKEAFSDAMYSYHVVSGDIQIISLPDTLISVDLKILNDASKSGSEDSSGESAIAVGSIELSSSAQLNYKIESGYTGPATAERHVFFLEESECDINAILGKTILKEPVPEEPVPEEPVPEEPVPEEPETEEPETEEPVQPIKFWPIIRPRSEFVEFTTTSEFKSAKIGLSLPNNTSRQSSTSKKLNRSVLSIPPTLHKEIIIIPRTVGPTSINTTIGVTSPTRGKFQKPLEISQVPFEVPKIEQTNPTSFPIGKFLYSVNTSPYRYGFIRVEATVVEVTGEMVSGSLEEEVQLE